MSQDLGNLEFEDFTWRRIKKLLNYICSCIEKTLKDNPSKIVTEGDLQALLYATLAEHADLKGRSFGSGKKQVFPVHSEYPRLYRNASNELRSFRRQYDLVVIRSERSSAEEEAFKNGGFKKPVNVAFEIKNRANCTVKSVRNAFDDELDAFTEESNKVGWRQTLPDFGVIFFHNFNVQQKMNWKELRLALRKSVEEKDKNLRALGLKRCGMFYCYIETASNMDNKALTQSKTEYFLFTDNN